MKNSEAWRPTKFVATGGGLRPSSDPNEIGRGSRLVGGILAPLYGRLLQAHARGVLLDLGCGSAPLYGVYKDLVEEVVCVDWSARDPGRDHLDHRMNLNEGLALEPESFDTVLATDLLEHIEAPDRLWEDVCRVLRPGGKVVLAVPFLYWLHEEPHDYHRYTEHRLRQLCRRGGLEVIELEPYGGAPEVVADIIAKHLSPSRVASFLYLWTARGVLALPPVRYVSRLGARRFPLGYALVAQKPMEAP